MVVHENDSATQLVERFENVHRRLADAARNAGRLVEDITLVAVSKFHPANSIATIAQVGHMQFGENYVQEALRKQEELRALGLQWHFIGHIQTNKAKDVAGRFALIHTVDSLRLAQSLQKGMQRTLSASCTCSENHGADSAHSASGSAPKQDILLQVNIGDEPQKSGIAPADVASLAEAVQELSFLRLCGLMCLPPFFDDGEAARPYFARMQRLKEDLEQRLGYALPYLSMGMSGDFVQAIEEGATIIRVGTDIFGSRPVRV